MRTLRRGARVFDGSGTLEEQVAPHDDEALRARGTPTPGRPWRPASRPSGTSATAATWPSACGASTTSAPSSPPGRRARTGGAGLRCRETHGHRRPRHPRVPDVGVPVLHRRGGGGRRRSRHGRPPRGRPRPRPRRHRIRSGGRGDIDRALHVHRRRGTALDTGSRAPRSSGSFRHRDLRQPRLPRLRVGAGARQGEHGHPVAGRRRAHGSRRARVRRHRRRHRPSKPHDVLPTTATPSPTPTPCPGSSGSGSGGGVWSNGAPPAAPASASCNCAAATR